MADTFNMSDVMISYSRKDTAFVKKLNNALLKSGRETWVDWEDIAPTVDWWQEIQAGIEAAHTFVFIITPSAIRSDYCRKEIEHAVTHNKRIIPILRQEITDPADQALLHPELSSHNWIMLRDQDNTKRGFKNLIRALETDLYHVRLHTRILVRANEWHTRKQSNSYLLRGDDLRDAEAWLQHSEGKNPKPTRLQVKYITRSRKVATTFIQQIIAVAVATFIILAAALIFALFQANNAVNALDLAEGNGQTAIANAETAEFNANDAATNLAIAQTNQSLADENGEEAQTQAAVAQLQATQAEQNAQTAIANANTAVAAQGTSEFNGTQSANNAETAIAEALTRVVAEEDAQTQAAIAQTNEANALEAEATAELEAQNAQTQAGIANENATQSALNAQAEQTQAQLAAQNAQTAQSAAMTANYNATLSAYNAQIAQTQAAIAQTNEAIANSNATQAAINEAIAQTAASVAEQEALRNQSLVLAQQAINALDAGDRPLAMHLALLAVKIAQDNGLGVALEVEAALNHVGNSIGLRYQFNPTDRPGRVYSLAYHPLDNDRFITVTRQYIDLWAWDVNANTYVVNQTIAIPSSDGAVTDIIYNSSGTHVIFSTDIGVISIRDANTLQPIASVPDIMIPPIAPATQVSITSLMLVADSDGITPDRLMFGTNAGGVGIRDFMTLSTITGIADIDVDGEITSLDYNSRWDRIYFATSTGVVGTRHGNLNLTNTADFSLNEPIADIVHDPLRSWVIIATESGQISIRWFNTLVIVREVNRAVGITDLAIYNNTLLVGTLARTVDVYNIHTFRLVKSFTEHTWEVRSVAISANGDRAISGAASGQIIVWDIQAGNLVHEFNEARNPIADAHFIPTGINNQYEYEIIAGGQNLYNWTFTPSGNAINVTQNILPQPPHTIRRIVYNPQHSEWIYSTARGEIVLEQGTLLSTTPQSDLYALDINRNNGNFMVTAGQADDGLFLWQRINNAWTQVVHDGNIPNMRNAMFSPDGRYLIVNTSHEIQVYQVDYTVPSLQYIDSFSFHVQPIHDLTFNPADPTKFATASYDGTVRLWDMSDINNLTVTNILDGHTSQVRRVAYHPDGTRLASASLDGTIRIWDEATGQLIHTIGGYYSEVSSVDFSPDGRYLVSGTGDSRSTVQLWVYRGLIELYNWVCGNQPVRDLTAQERVIYNVENIAFPCINYIPQPRYVDPTPILIPLPVTPTREPMMIPEETLISDPIRVTMTPTPSLTASIDPIITSTVTPSATPLDIITITPSPIPTITMLPPSPEITADVSIPTQTPTWTASPTVATFTMSPSPTATITMSPSPTWTATP